MSDPLETNLLKLPYLAAAQAQKHVTHNEALRLLDTIVQLAVLDTTLTDPPGSPAEGDRYIVAAGATGDWASQDDNVATSSTAPGRSPRRRGGWLGFDLNSEAILVFLAGGWSRRRACPARSPSLASTPRRTRPTGWRSARRACSSPASRRPTAAAATSASPSTRKPPPTPPRCSSRAAGRAGPRSASPATTTSSSRFRADGTAWVEAIRIDKDTGLPAILYDNGASGLSATTVQDALDEVAAGGGGGGGAVASVFGRTGAVAAAAGDYDASQVDNDSGVSGTTVKDALDALASGVAGKQEYRRRPDRACRHPSNCWPARPHRRRHGGGAHDYRRHTASR